MNFGDSDMCVPFSDGPFNGADWKEVLIKYFVTEYEPGKEGVLACRYVDGRLNLVAFFSSRWMRYDGETCSINFSARDAMLEIDDVQIQTLQRIATPK
jgi:hypothetical protein